MAAFRGLFAQLHFDRNLWSTDPILIIGVSSLLKGQIQMINQYLAALFCTTGLILWAINASYDQQNTNRSKFGIIYGCSMLGWMALGAYVNSSGLVIIGTVQFIAAIALYFFSYKKV